MPLYERVRVEIYLPEPPEQPQYQDFLETLRHELAWAFGGCSVIRDVRGIFRASVGPLVEDRVNVLYTDMSLSLETDFAVVERYAETLQKSVSDTLNLEETVLVTVSKIYWTG